MKFKSSVSELQKAAKLLLPVINYNHPVLGFRYLKVYVNNGKVEFKAFDNTVIASVFPQYAELEDDGVYGNVLAKQFVSLMYSFKSEEVVISIDKENCIIKSGKSRYKIPLLDKAVFETQVKDLDLDYYSIKFDKGVKVKHFVTRANSVLHCLSKDDYHKDLQHIYIKDGKMIACDGGKGASVEFTDVSLDGYCIYKKIVDCVSNVTDSTDISFKATDGVLYGSTGKFLFAASLDNVEYPYDKISPYIEAFKDKHKYNIHVDVDEFSEKLNRILMFADSETNSVCISFKGNDITMNVENTSFAEESFTTLGKPFEKEFSLFVDGKSLKELLSKTVSDTYWVTDGETHTQYIHDGELTQFFLGLSK